MPGCLALVKLCCQNAETPCISAALALTSTIVTISFPEQLPISSRVIDIARAIDANPVVIVAGETGSGKTTQLPKICLAMGRGVDRQIACTQPRRIAATSVAARVAQEVGTELGQDIGYKIRFDEKTNPKTYVTFMTDGILLAEIPSNPLLKNYDTIIVDEAHERSLNIDFLLGYLKRLLPKRPDLRVIVSSATLELERFSKFFADAPVIKVEGRTYPVDVIYRPPNEDETDVSDAVANTVEEITQLEPRGDILVFLPGEREIRESANELSARKLRHTQLYPLYSRLSAAEQSRIFDSTTHRKVILATNVAETSLTIPGITFVVDAGLARINRYVPRTGVTELQIESISRASADQRKGRSGRVRHGICFRLYTEDDFKLRSEYTDPEILRTGLAGVLLRMKSLKLGDVESFPFLDPPSSRAITEGYRVLEELGALDDHRELTPIGHQLARFPLDPRLSRMILAGAEHGSLSEVLILAAALGLQDPRERPAAAKNEADQAHRQFRDESSDFLGWLKLWAFFDEAQSTLSNNQLRKFCQKNFLSYLRMREWRELHQQLLRITKELGMTPNTKLADYEQIHKALLPGLLSRIGFWNQELRSYTGAKQVRFSLHPASGLAKKPPPWVMVAELVETSQLFARHAALIDPVWLESLGSHLIKRSYSDPHWEQKPARVTAKEQVTLYGLPIIRDRRIDFGLINPSISRRLFIEHALVRGEYKTKGKFQDHNLSMFEQAKMLRNKARRSDMLADDNALAVFFEKRIPDEVVGGKSFEEWREAAEKKDPRILFLSLEDILQDEAAELSTKMFPDQVVLHGVKIPLSYLFDPSSDEDGVSATVPLALLPQIDPEITDAIVPGMLREKVIALLHALPKQVKRDIDSIVEVALAITPKLNPLVRPFLEDLGNLLYQETGVKADRDHWRLDDIAPYLNFYFKVIDDTDKVVASGRDLRQLQERLGLRARQAWQATETALKEKKGLRTWDMGDLADSVSVKVGGRQMSAFPALVDQSTHVDLVLMPSRDDAEKATRAGLRRLMMIATRTTIDVLEGRLPKTWPHIDGGVLRTTDFAPIRQSLIYRAVDETFLLDHVRDWPRTKKQFQDRVDQKKSQLTQGFDSWSSLAKEIATEFDKVAQALRAPAVKHCPKTTLEEIKQHVLVLVPPDLFESPKNRLVHLPRYLKGVQLRLSRLPNDPRKDEQKYQQLKSLWVQYWQANERVRVKDPQAAEEYRWLLEEWRVAIFAPELKTPVSVSQKKLEEMWRALSKLASEGRTEGQKGTR